MEEKRDIPEQHPPGTAVDNQTLQERICNPLSGIPRGHLMSDVEDFAARNGLQQHTAILKKGALIAQNPDQAYAIDGEEKLTPHELSVLERESTHKWHMPKRLLLTIATCSVAAAIQGWDQTGSNGATIFFRKYYGIDSAGPGDNIIIGLVNAAPYIGSA
ncbi:hypothetical protein ESCO_002775 [Escovopsis weberi]|uniref:Transporter n=1 Tax=Escovopsis weberi TaxID=150374 RepID=A0A0M8N128_ESCWE|nr:hypothetical protein ESCO_002775 [Escovopsis weberi]